MRYLFVFLLVGLASCGLENPNRCDICIENNYDLSGKYSDSFPSLSHDEYLKILDRINSEETLGKDVIAPLTWQVPSKYLDSADLLIRDSCNKNGEGLLKYFLELEYCYK